MQFEKRLDTILADYFDKVDSGELVDPQDFINANPDVARELTSFFKDLGTVNTLVDDATTPADKLQPEPIPEKIDRFEVQAVLGEGGFGRVFLAFDEVLQRHVAIKVPHAHRVKLSTARELYLREGRILAELSHSNIVTVYEVGECDNGICYTVMKYIEGESLAERIKHESVEVEQAIELLIQMADGLQSAHDRGVIHRDLKPSNILLDESNHVFIADFGLATRENQPWNLRGKLLGTRSYMAPQP